MLDVVDDVGIKKYFRVWMEKVVMIYEFGYLVGMVNLGLVMISEYYYVEIGVYCINLDCIMMYVSEVGGDLKVFIFKYMVTNSMDLFGFECLNDVYVVSQ